MTFRPFHDQQRHAGGAKLALDGLQEPSAPGQAGEVADDQAADASTADVGQQTAEPGPVGV
jgi:hypothetical protein